MKVTKQQKADLIRIGNKAFNEGRIEHAAQIFKALKYQDGLIRLGDHFYFKKYQPLRAYGYYRLAKNNKMIEKIQEGFDFALKCWLIPDKIGEENKS